MFRLVYSTTTAHPLVLLLQHWELTCSLQKTMLWKSYSAMILIGVPMLAEPDDHKQLANSLIVIDVGCRSHRFVYGCC